MKGEYLEYKFWKGDKCYFRRLKWWEIILYKVRLFNRLVIFVPK